MKTMKLIWLGCMLATLMATGCTYSRQRLIDRLESGSLPSHQVDKVAGGQLPASQTAVTVGHAA